MNNLKAIILIHGNFENDEGDVCPGYIDGVRKLAFALKK